MHFRTLGISILALGLAACGEVNDARTASSEEVAGSLDQSNLPQLPRLTASEISANWGGEALNPTTQISVSMNGESVTLSRVADGDSRSGRTSGANVEFIDASRYDLSGVELEITVRARAVSAPGSSFYVVYTTASKGNSGWHEFTADTDLQEFTFSYLIPDGYDASPDFVGISVDEGNEVEIMEVSVVGSS